VTSDEPLGSYLQPLEADMTPDECKTALREVLGISPGGRMAFPTGLDRNDRVFMMLVGIAQGRVNTSNKILGAIARVDADVTPLADDEAKILAAIATLPTSELPADQIEALAAGIVDRFGTTVALDKLSAAVAHDVVAAEAAAWCGESPTVPRRRETLTPC